MASCARARHPIREAGHVDRKSTTGFAWPAFATQAPARALDWSAPAQAVSWWAGIDPSMDALVFATLFVTAMLKGMMELGLFICM